MRGQGERSPLLNKLQVLLKFPDAGRLLGIHLVARRTLVVLVQNSGRLIPDNCYHGHGLHGARLEITATSCLLTPTPSPPPCPPLRGAFIILHSADHSDTEFGHASFAVTFTEKRVARKMHAKSPFSLSKPENL